MNIEFLNNLSRETVKDAPFLIEEIFDLYFEIFPEKLINLEQCLQSSDIPELLKLAHFLKGQAAAVGFIGHENQFVKIEHLAKKNKMVEISFLVKLLKESITELKIEADAYLLAKQKKKDN